MGHISAVVCLCVSANNATKFELSLRLMVQIQMSVIRTN